MCFCLQKNKLKSFDGKLTLVLLEGEKQGHEATECLHFSKQKTSSSLVLTGSVGQTNKSGNSKFVKNLRSLRCFCGRPKAFFQAKSLNTVGNKIRATSKENCSFFSYRQTGFRAERFGCLEHLDVTVTFTSETFS